MRRRRILLSFLAILPLACETPTDAADAAGAPDAVAADASGPMPFRVVTWNVLDLFDEVDKTTSPGAEDTVLTPGEVSAKLTAVGGVLGALDADLIFLQEVENLALLERLADGPLAGRGYHATLVESFDPRGIDIGVLSKPAIDRYVSHLGEKDPEGRYLWSRDCVDVYVTVAGRSVVFLGEHFISKQGDNDQRRTYQAQAARDHADAAAAADPDAVVGVTGDFNDDPGSAPLQPLLGDGVYRDQGATLPPVEAWTYDGGSWGTSRVDFVLVHQRSVGYVTDVSVYDGSGVSTSDHRPVVVDMIIPPP